MSDPTYAAALQLVMQIDALLSGTLEPDVGAQTSRRGETPSTERTFL